MNEAGDNTIFVEQGNALPPPFEISSAPPATINLINPIINIFPGQTFNGDEIQNQFFLGNPINYDSTPVPQIVDAPTTVLPLFPAPKQGSPRRNKLVRIVLNILLLVGVLIGCYWLISSPQALLLVAFLADTNTKLFVTENSIELLLVIFGQLLQLIFE